MKSLNQYKTICIILAISMLLLGISCGEPLPYSSFSCTQTVPEAPVLRASGGQLNSHIYKEENKLTGLGEFTLARQNPRTVTILRLNPLFVLFLFTGIPGLTAVFFTILSLRGTSRNQCGVRTLQYIHRKDGKKHNS